MVALVPTNCYTADVRAVLLEPLGDPQVGHSLLDLLVDALNERGPTGVAARQDWG